MISSVHDFGAIMLLALNRSVVRSVVPLFHHFGSWFCFFILFLFLFFNPAADG